MELSFNFIAVIFITIRALAKSKIITYVRGKLKNLHDEIKCFSIILAPIATDATATSLPKVWSESPTTVLKFSFKSGIVLRFISSNGAG